MNICQRLNYPTKYFVPITSDHGLNPCLILPAKTKSSLTNLSHGTLTKLRLISKSMFKWNNLRITCIPTYMPIYIHAVAYKYILTYKHTGYMYMHATYIQIDMPSYTHTWIHIYFNNICTNKTYTYLYSYKHAYNHTWVHTHIHENIFQ